jgi:hypothetical protein
VTTGVAEGTQVEVRVSVDPTSVDESALAKPEEEATAQVTKSESVMAHVTGYAAPL